VHIRQRPKIIYIRNGQRIYPVLIISVLCPSATTVEIKQKIQYWMI